MTKVKLLLIAAAIAAAAVVGSSQSALADGGPLILCAPHDLHCRCAASSCPTLVPEQS